MVLQSFWRRVLKQENQRRCLFDKTVHKECMYSANNTKEKANVAEHKLLYLMKDHRFVSKINKWLRETECQGPQPCSKPSNKNKCLHYDMPPASSCRLHGQNLNKNRNTDQYRMQRTCMELCIGFLDLK